MSPDIINLLVSVAETNCVSCEVRTEFINNVYFNFNVKVKGFALLPYSRESKIRSSALGGGGHVKKNNYPDEGQQQFINQSNLKGKGHS
jgi:hypothetical protein